MTSTDIEDDGSIYINFSDTPERPKFYLLPAGLKVIVEITDYDEERSESKKNPGAKMINWTFTVESTEDGDEAVYNVRARDPETNKTELVEELKVEGRRLFDRMVFIEEMYDRVRKFMDAMGYETEGDIRLVPSELVGERLVVTVGVQPRKKSKESGEWYKARNKVNSYHPVPGAEEPTPEPVAEEKPKAKAKAKEEQEEAKV